MKTIIESNFGEINYEESFWTGKKKILINGVELTKVDKKTFFYKVEDNVKYVSIQGNYFTGLTLTIENENIQVIEKTTFFEYILVILPIIFVIVWGNSVTLTQIFPVVGGALGGALSALISLSGLVIAKAVKQKWARLLVLFAGAVMTILVCFLVAMLLIG